MFRHLVATAARRGSAAGIAATRRTPPRQGQACRCLATTPETPPQPKRSKPEALAALARVDAPAGTLLLYWPGAWSIALAAPPGALPDMKLLALFGAGSIVMRGAGCTINDILDRDVDGAVERTKTRPLAANELSVQEATAFLALQLTCGLGILTQLDMSSIALGACSVPLVLTCVEIKFTARSLNRRVDLHAIDATPARWRGHVGSSPLDGASTAASCTRLTG